MKLSRGDLVLVDLDPTKGSEQGKRRPGVVIQNNTGNKHSPITIVAPVTSKYERLYPVNVEIKASESSLEKDSAVLLNQIRAVSIKHRVEEKIGSLERNKMEEVDDALEVSLGLK